MNQSNKLLYSIQGIACIFVVLIHCRIPGNLGINVVAVARVAVPFFFCVSGYYLIENAQDKINSVEIRARIKKRMARYCKSFLLVYGGGYTVYAIIRILIGESSLRDYFANKFTYGNILVLLCFNHGNILEVNEYSPDFMWFLLALLYVHLILYFLGAILNRREGEFAIILFIALEMMLQVCRGKRFILAGHEYSQLLFVLNYLFFGLPFVLIGICIRRYKDILMLSGLGWIAVFILSFSAIFEMKQFGPSDVYISSILQVILIMIMAGNRKDVSIPFIEYIGKYLSADIYYVHVLIKIILIDIDNTLVYIGRGYFFPLCVVVISVIVAYVKCKIKEKLYDYAQQS